MAHHCNSVFKQLSVIKSCLCYGAWSILQVVEKIYWSLDEACLKNACAWHTKLGARTNAELHNYHDDTEIIECKSVSVDKQKSQLMHTTNLLHAL